MIFYALLYTTYISVDLAQHGLFRAKVGKDGIKSFRSHEGFLINIKKQSSHQVLRYTAAKCYNTVYTIISYESKNMRICMNIESTVLFVCLFSSCFVLFFFHVHDVARISYSKIFHAISHSSLFVLTYFYALI